MAHAETYEEMGVRLYAKTVNKDEDYKKYLGFTNKDEYFASLIFEENRKQFNAVVDSIQGKNMEYIKGMKCKFQTCRQEKLTYVYKKTRSSDEGMATFLYCNACGRMWKYDG